MAKRFWNRRPHQSTFEDILAERCANAPMEWIDEQLLASNIDYPGVHARVVTLVRQYVTTTQSSNLFKRRVYRVAASVLIGVVLLTSNGGRLNQRKQNEVTLIPRPLLTDRRLTTGAATSVTMSTSNSSDGLVFSAWDSRAHDVVPITNSTTVDAAVQYEWIQTPETTARPNANGQQSRKESDAVGGMTVIDTIPPQVSPASTLLLPYFEIDSQNQTSETAQTVFTITNVSTQPQIAHVTVWTDRSFPILDFNIFLTGYDVQSINLFDVIVRGIVPPGTPAGTSDGTVSLTAAGSGTLPADLVTAVKNALTVGAPYVASTVSCGATPVGGDHGARAVGYVTVDVTSNGASGAILFDNTLIGDYQQIGLTSASAGTAVSFDNQRIPMVHIRAIPDGGGRSGVNGGVTMATNLPVNFYDRYTTAPGSIDRRPPPPSKWAARHIGGGTAGFSTGYKIWREGQTADCSVSDNSTPLVSSIVRFDEYENSFGFGSETNCSPCGPGGDSLLTNLGGWMYLNLSNNNATAANLQRVVHAAQRPSLGSPTTSQNWVIVSMFGTLGANRLSVDFDAAWLGNSCISAPAPGTTTAQ